VKEAAWLEPQLSVTSELVNCEIDMYVIVMGHTMKYAYIIHELAIKQFHIMNCCCVAKQP